MRIATLHRILFALAAGGSIASIAFAAPRSPYVDEAERPIKALSAEDTQAYRDGQGMGLARAAELNGYPGPRHVLDLADELKLTAAQREQSQALFEAMQARARRFGRALVQAEAELDRQFATRKIDAKSLDAALARIGALQAQVRGAHLKAHLRQVALLDAQQVAAYARLRGYATGQGRAEHHGH